MTIKKPSAKSTKAEILEAYEELSKEKASIKSQLDQAIKEKKTTPVVKEQIKEQVKESVKIETKIEDKSVMNQSQSAQQKINVTIESLAKIQLGFGSAVSELSEQLSTKASQLEEIRKFTTTEVEQLKALHNLEIEENTLDTLIASYEENSKTYQQEYSDRYETLFQQIEEQRKAWEKEKDEYKNTIKERNENLTKTRQRDSAEYKYDLELQRKINSNTYELEQKELHQQLEEFSQEVEKQWSEREKTISDKEKLFEEAKAKVEAFPKEKEAAMKKATEEGKGIAHYQAKIKSDLYGKEVEGQKRFYEQRLQSLEQTITNQENRIQNLSQQLASALKQVQDLAVKAIEGSSNVNSYQAMKETALEQAKTQAKNK